MELIKAAGNTYYFSNPSSIGLYVTNEGNGILIDAGLDDDAARKILGELERNGITLTSIIVTHGHADHFGGAKKLVSRTGCKVYASRLEAPFIENGIMEPYMMYGAHPLKALRKKSLMAKGVVVYGYLEHGECIIDGASFQIEELHGHSVGHIGVITPDSVFFVGDALMGDDVTDKYKLLFLYDVESTLKSLERLRIIPAKKYVLGHGGETVSISVSIERNLESIRTVSDAILRSLSGSGKTLEKLYSDVALELGVMESVDLHFVNLSAFKAHLSYLYDMGHVDLLHDKKLRLIEYSLR